jgi:TonB family C-terminal domain
MKKIFIIALMAIFAMGMSINAQQQRQEWTSAERVIFDSISAYEASRLAEYIQNGELAALKVENTDEQVFQIVEKMPSFPGGNDALNQYLNENIKYPADAAKNSIQGRVICRFVVSDNGSITDIEVVRSVDSDLDKEAVRVIQSMPKWTPGTQRGQAVNVRYTLPINFRLQTTPKVEDADEQVFQVVEKMPIFPGGNDALSQYLSKNIKYPGDAVDKGIQGSVICQFVVTKDGSITDVKVVRSVDSDLDKEAVRVIQSMPKWTPGTQRGKEVNVRYTMPVNFRLQ